MKPIDETIEFPVKLIDEDGETEIYENLEEIKTNLEDYNSEVDSDCAIIDAQGRYLHLVISTTFIEEFYVVST